MKAIANFQNTGISDRDNSANRDEIEIHNGRAYFFSYNFYNFRFGDMGAYYFPHRATKFSALHYIAVWFGCADRKSQIELCTMNLRRHVYWSRYEILINKYWLDNSLRIIFKPHADLQDKENRTAWPMKRQICESKTGKPLPDENMKVYFRTDAGNLPPFLLQSSKQKN